MPIHPDVEVERPREVVWKSKDQDHFFSPGFLSDGSDHEDQSPRPGKPAWIGQVPGVDARRPLPGKAQSSKQ